MKDKKLMKNLSFKKKALPKKYYSTMKKTATLLLVLLLIGSFLGVTAIGSTTAEDLTSLPDDAYDAINPDYRRSESPYLRLPDDMKNWPPITPSEPRRVGEVEDPTAVEIYTVATGEVIQIPSNATTQQPVKSDIDSIPPYQGLLPPGFVLESVLPPDDRSRITNTETYPWRTVCKLFMTFPDGATGGCSGAIIGCPDGHGYHVLTAGHCVYSHSHGGWARSIKLVPGLDDDYMPYNYAWATYLRSYTYWTVYGMSEHDWAVVTLDRNVGDYTGWMGRQTADPSNSIYTGIKNIAGYPGDKPDGTMWFDADNAHSTDEHNYWYYMDTYAGMSGGPVWLYTSAGSRYILATHTCGTGGCGIAGKGVNHGTRLNQDKFNRIITWCNADTPPTDKADLIDDGQAYSGFSPTAVKPGSTSFHAWCDVRNVGTASSSGFYVSYYASTNTVITSSDYLICTDYVPSINPFDWEDSDSYCTFPSGVPDGSYWVGWIIDSGNHVTEFDENNNVAYKDSYKLLVDGTPPSAPVISSSTHPDENVWYSNNDPTFTWTTPSDPSGIACYSYTIDHSSSTTPDTTCDTTGNSKSYTNLGDGIWYFHVRAKDNVGNWGSADHYRVKIDTTSPPAPVISSSTHPNENVWYCNRNPTFTWTTPSDPSGIACYSYTIDHSSSTTPDTTCDTTGNSKSYTNLAYGTWYFHVRAKDKAGNWGPADHYRVRIEDCDLKDGCYAYGTGCEDRDYYCGGSVCTYTYSNRHTDYYDDWVTYCKGDEVWKHRLFHDFYCEGGSCKDHTSWKDDQLVENCNDHDGWYDTGDTRWVDNPANECKEKEQKKQEYRDYTCSGGACTYRVTNTQWIDTGNERNKPDGTDCGADYYDDWVTYCKGDEVWKHRLFHDFYCEGGSCKDHTSWKDDQLVENCNDHDDWYDTGETRWIDNPANECKEKEQKKQEYRDYTCSGGACTYSVTNTQWIDTGNERNKPDGTVCGCTANNTLKECYQGMCTDTGICNSTICGADAPCNGKKPGDYCNADSKCNATCKCVSVEKPDLVITDKWVCWPDNCTICYNVTNIGNGAASAGHNTTLFVDDVAIAHDPMSISLAPTESYTGCFNYIWTYTSPSDNITVCADNNDTVDESNETNNCLENIWMCGDVNCNEVVDLSDEIDLLYYVGYPGHYTICNQWAADVNCDKSIDRSDVRTLLYFVGYPRQYELSCCCKISG